LKPCLILALPTCVPVVQPRLSAHQQPRLTDDAAIMRDGVRLPLSRWLPATPPKTAVIAVHGFNDHAGAFADLGPALARDPRFIRETRIDSLYGLVNLMDRALRRRGLYVWRCWCCMASAPRSSPGAPSV
jgi:hypothetical protein